MADRIIIKNTTLEANLDNIQATDILNGELLLVREADKERLYCKNAADEIVPVHIILDAGSFSYTGLYNKVDLGLPSGLLWADKNIGAATEEESGLYFAWGDTIGYIIEQVGVDKQFNWDGEVVPLEKVDDAARVNMGSEWRIPTREELQELVIYTDICVVLEIGAIEVVIPYTGGKYNTFAGPETKEKIKGLKFYNKSDHSKYIFIPSGGAALAGSVQAIGEYVNIWSSLIDYENLDCAWCLNFSAKDGAGDIGNMGRFLGYPIRGVKK